MFVVTSVPEVRAEGAELEPAFQATRELSFNAGLTYAFSYFPDSAENRAVLTTASGLQRLPGSRLSLAPEWSLTGGVSDLHEIYDGLYLNSALDLKFVTNYNTGSDLDPAKRQNAFALWNGVLGIGPKDQRWNLSIYAQNIFNQRYFQVAYNGALTTLGVAGLNTYNAFLGNPRTFGATLRVKY